MKYNGHHGVWHNRNRESIAYMLDETAPTIMDYKVADSPAYDPHIPERETMRKPNGAGVRAAQAREDAVLDTLMKNSLERIQVQRDREQLTLALYRIESLEERVEQLELTESINQY